MHFHSLPPLGYSRFVAPQPFNPLAVSQKPASRAPAGATEITKLRKAASEFEATLISSWWTAMKNSGLSDDDDSDPGKDTLDQLGMRALSTAMTSGKGLGIGDMSVRSLLSKQYPEHSGDPEPQKLPSVGPGT